MNRETLASRLLSRLDYSGDCVNWTGEIMDCGYGRIRVGGKKWLTHRLTYTLQNGEIPEGLWIDHKCSNRACCNPSHLQAVPPSLNAENREGARIDNGSGVRGVGWHRESRKWRVRAQANGKSYYGGRFDNLVDAEAAAIALRNRVQVNNLGDPKESEVPSMNGAE